MAFGGVRGLPDDLDIGSDGVLVFEQKRTKYGGSICEISVKRASEVDLMPENGLAEQYLAEELGLD